MSACASLPRKNLVIAVRICILSLAGALLLAVAPAAAVAKPGCGGSAPVPGGSEIDQYAQSIPGACGNQENGTPPSGGAGDPPAEVGEGADRRAPGPRPHPRSHRRPSSGFRTWGRPGRRRRRSPRPTRRASRRTTRADPDGSSGGGSKAGTAIDTPAQLGQQRLRDGDRAAADPARDRRLWGPVHRPPTTGSARLSRV